MSTKLSKLSQSECFDFFQRVQNKSDSHFLVAEEIANRSEYGMAISHLILGSEELIKALILFFQGEKLNLASINEIDKFFFQHKVRHSFSQLYTIMGIFLRPITVFSKRIHDLINDKISREKIKNLEKAIIEGDVLTFKTITERWQRMNLPKVVRKMNDYNDFWESAEKYKQLGFYADFENSITLDKVDYQKAKVVANSLRKDCKDLIDFITKLDIKDREMIIMRWECKLNSVW